jgi:hypothetical protein
MALPTVADLKAYCRIETTAEDALLTALLARAVFLWESLCGGLPITARTFEYVDDPLDGYPGPAPDVRRADTLLLPTRPVAVTSVEDLDGTVVDPSTYRVYPSRGRISAVAGEEFIRGPYTITYQAGLSLYPDYATAIEPVVSSAILDLAADLYWRRMAGATGESAAGESVTWDASREVVARVLPLLRRFRPPVVA